MGRPGPIERFLRGVGAIVLLPLALMMWSAGAFFHALFGASPRQAHRYYVGFARTCVTVAGTRIEVRGREHIRPGQAYVVVSNHESNWDPPVILSSLPELVIRFVLKQQLLSVPVFGPALRRTGNIAVERARSGNDVRRVQAGMSERPAEVSILFFAEGNRARDGSYREFKMGAFATALDFKLPILPIAVAGTFPIWPPGRVWLAPAPVVLEIGAPIPVEGLSAGDRTRLRDEAQRVIGGLRASARARLRAQGVDPGGVD
ncbi:MAG TPA: lysophospholipid acyltransferase family protein [Myxococcota bacterium]|nr:lysophospholipid acyltransferase family protein [Myxococcota bacterium]